MASNKLARTNDDIQRVISSLLRNVKDPRVQQGMISVTRVETTGDLALLQDLAVRDGHEGRKGVQKGPEVRFRLAADGSWAAAMNLRYTPELVFEIDHSIEYGAHISQVINSLDIKHDEGESDEL